MTKTEIKNRIKKEWDKLDNLIENPNTLSTDNEELVSTKLYLKLMHTFILDGLLNDELSKESIHIALKNLLWRKEDSE